MVFRCVEFGTLVSNVDFVEGVKFLHFLRCESIGDSLECNGS